MWSSLYGLWMRVRRGWYGTVYVPNRPVGQRQLQCTKVLSLETSYDRNYDVDPYEGYYRALGFMFPVGAVRTDLKAKEMVLGIEISGIAKAYPMSLLEGQDAVINDKVGVTPIQIVL